MGLHVEERAFQFFDHTGDFGAELRAPSLEALFATAAQALLVLLTDAAETVAERDTRELEVEGVDESDLLVALGNELLYLFEAEEWLTARLEVVEVDETWLRATASGELFDPARHPIARPIKAVTHHGVWVEPGESGGYRARVIFDL